jgi:hypothetical protein
MMEENTLMERNWIIDSDMTERPKSLPKINYIINTVNSQIKNFHQNNIDNKDDSDQFSSNELSKNEFYFLIPTINAKPAIDPNNHFSKTQRWIGYVSYIDKNIFKAKLKDLTNHGTDEEGEFELKEISKGDRELFKMGGVFYWSVGYNVVNGQTIKESLIRFKRSSDWTVDDINEIADRANELNSDLNWE